MLCTVSNSNIGGRVLDLTLAHHFAANFKAETGIDVKQNPRAWLMLVTEAEKFKKVVSGQDATRQSFLLVNFVDGEDLSSSMDRFWNFYGISTSS
jgi:molecular chaperone DnaK (HSP70)